MKTSQDYSPAWATKAQIPGSRQSDREIIMGTQFTPVPSLLDLLESHYGPQQPNWPVDPYEFLIWWYCGYPASDARCARGWAQLNSAIGIEPQRILAASQPQLAKALQGSGMVPELRALRLQQIAALVVDHYGGNLDALFTGPLPAIRTALKTFPSIADPGADRILLFARKSPIAAVPSNCPQVLVRMAHGLEHESYSATYREAQQLIEKELPEQFHPRQRAYLLLKVHGQTICKTRPKCVVCPITAHCAYAQGVTRGGRPPIP
jgi:endonuclease III